MTERSNERFEAFIDAIFRWKTLEPKDFPREAGLCVRGIIRLESHMRAQTLYACSYSVQGDAEFCGDGIDFIGTTETMNRDLDYLTHANATARPHLYGRSSRGGSLQRVQRPSIPDRYLPLICNLYRHDFCCLGFSVPLLCGGLSFCSSAPIMPFRNWITHPVSRVGLAAEVTEFRRKFNTSS